MVILGCKLLLLLLSFYGYFLYVNRNGFSLSFAPVLTLSGIGVAMFLAGILNFMPLATKGIFLGGLLLLGWQLLPSKRQLPKLSELLPIAFFTLLLCFFALRLRGVRVTSYDNFSHWLLVVRDMLQMDTLPNFRSAQIEFQSYPTGTAGFLYYICRILGEQEGIMLFAQALLMAAGLTVFWDAGKRPLWAAPAIFGVSLYMLVSNLQITDLSVDTVLTVQAVAGFALLDAYRKDLKKAGLGLGLLGAYLVLVKNSGIFFLLLHGFYLALLCFREHREQGRKLCKADWTPVLWSVLPALLLIFLWNRHVSYVFFSGNLAKHSMSLENYSQVFGEKSPQQILEIAGVFARRMLHPERELLILGSLLALAVLGIVTTRGQERKETALFIGWEVLVYAVYVAGLFAMYLFSMPYEESMMLGSFWRYLNTVIMYLVGIAVLHLLRRCKWGELLAVVLVLVVLYPWMGKLPGFFINQQNYASTSRAHLEQLHRDYEIEDGASYCIIAPFEYGYTYWLARYEFWSLDVAVWETPEEEDLTDFYDRFDYLILQSQEINAQELLTALGLPQGQEVYALEQYRAQQGE